MPKEIKCYFCKNEIKQDRYEVLLTQLRQDFPNTKWNTSIAVTLENVCSNCNDKLTAGFKQVVRNLENQFKV